MTLLSQFHVGWPLSSFAHEWGFPGTQDLAKTKTTLDKPRHLVTPVIRNDFLSGRNWLSFYIKYSGMDGCYLVAFFFRLQTKFLISRRLLDGFCCCLLALVYTGSCVTLSAHLTAGSRKVYFRKLRNFFKNFF